MKTSSILKLKKRNQEGDIAHEYGALYNMLLDKDTVIDGVPHKKDEIIEFRTDQIGVDLNNPLSIECQPSYDGTVNLIINDDKNPPRIINDRITRIENDRYRIINRNQIEQTNLYKKDEVDSRTRLFRNLNKIPKISLRGINHFGRLKGGNYTFYVKFADNDYNQTDIVCESGIVSIFKGDLQNIKSISGTLADELTDKTINLTISNIDRTFSKVYLYYIRTTSDLNGYPVSETRVVKRPYEIKDSTMVISLNGFEEVEEIAEEELNVKYNLVTAAKTQAQVQNMLFFGNVQGVTLNNKDLQNISLYIPVSLQQENQTIGYVTTKYESKTSDDINQNEYYNPMNIYYKLGYWPGEIYRLGIVYIMNDDSLTPVYNLRGCRFGNIGDINFDSSSSYPSLWVLDKDGKPTNEMKYVPNDDFIEEDNYLDNTKGVFRVSVKESVIDHGKSTIKPISFKATISEDIQNTLKKYGVKGYFLVRQKRIPITLCQGLSIGVDKTSYIPMLYNTNKSKYFTESFIDNKGILSTGWGSRVIETSDKQTSGLLSVEAMTNPNLKSIFDGTNYTLQEVFDGTLSSDSIRAYTIKSDKFLQSSTIIKTNTTFIPTDVPLKYINDFGFSTRAGAAEEAKSFGFFGNKDYSKDNRKLVRGVYTPFLGCNQRLKDNSIYNVMIQNYSTVFEKEYFGIRANDNTEFNAISDRFELGGENTISLYRGDCYSVTVTVRMNRNFIDSETPTNETIVDPYTWLGINVPKNLKSIVGKEESGYNGYQDTSADRWLSINRADLNAVPMGHWVTFKCLANGNIGLRSEDPNHVEEMSLMGNARTFYPMSSMSVSSSNKTEESYLYNQGYSATLGHKRNYPVPNVPYIKDLFDNRLMFSNVQVDDDFRNAYRVFQGLSFKDIDRQYGAIVKILPWNENIFCVFEHGLAIIPINEKALISTSTGQSIHMYGAGVLQTQVSLISPDYGSIWAESIIRTPYGVYGVDTYAKKIWRYSDQKGLELLSDMKIQRFLNDHITLYEHEKYPTIAVRNVKSHFNNYKGDIMFTFYNDDREEWNFCYNERLDKWITQYSWTPLYSGNINNVFYSLDKKRAEVLAIIYDNQHTSAGLRLGDGQNEWERTKDYTAELSVIDYSFFETFTYEAGDKRLNTPKSNLVTSSYLDSEGNEVYVEWPVKDVVTITRDTVSLDKKVLVYTDSKKVDHKLYYWKFPITITPSVVPENETSAVNGNKFVQMVAVISKYTELEPDEKAEYDKLLKNGFYVHGRAGIFNEMDFTDSQALNKILPTKWYDKQEPFEFEFVVNQPSGLHKMFNDLIILSNNVEPESLEIEVTGDVYHFKKENIFGNTKIDGYTGPDPDVKFPKIILDEAGTKTYQTEVVWDNVLNEYSLRSHQDCLNIRQYGRRLGNIQYVEDSWRTVISPIYYTDILNKDGLHTTRIRDKYAKIRIKYKGDKLAVIMAIQTLVNISYA